MFSFHHWLLCVLLMSMPFVLLVLLCISALSNASILSISEHFSLNHSAFACLHLLLISCFIFSRWPHWFSVLSFHVPKTYKDVNSHWMMIQWHLLLKVSFIGWEINLELMPTDLTLFMLLFFYKNIVKSHESS